MHGHMSRWTVTCHDERSRVTIHGHVARFTVTCHDALSRVTMHGHTSRWTVTCHDERSRVTIHGHVSRFTVTCHDARSVVTIHGHVSRLTVTCHDSRSRVTMHGHMNVKDEIFCWPTTMQTQTILVFPCQQVTILYCKRYMLFNNNTNRTYCGIDTATVVTRTRYEITLHVGRCNGTKCFGTVSVFVTKNTSFNQYVSFAPYCIQGVTGGKDQTSGECSLC